MRLGPWILLVASPLLASIALAEEGGETTEAECFPPCRSGYLCHQGKCISACNPPCPAGEKCVDNDCVATPAVAATASEDMLELDPCRTQTDCRQPYHCVQGQCRPTAAFVAEYRASADRHVTAGAVLLAIGGAGMLAGFIALGVLQGDDAGDDDWKYMALPELAGGVLIAALGGIVLSVGLNKDSRAKALETALQPTVWLGPQGAGVGLAARF